MEKNRKENEKFYCKKLEEWIYIDNSDMKLI